MNIHEYQAKAILNIVSSDGMADAAEKIVKAVNN